MELMKDPTFWVTLALVVFLALLAYQGVPGMIAAALLTLLIMYR